MKTKKTKIVALVLTVVLLTSSLSFLSFADNKKTVGNLDISFRSSGGEAKSDNIKDHFKYFSTDLEGTYDYFYRDGYFSASSYKYNEHLATMSMILALSAFPSGSFFEDTYANATSLFFDIGFDSVEANTETDLAPTPYTMGLVMAKKTVIDGSRPYTLVAISFRGSGYGSEWANNFTVGSAEEYPEGHKGFIESRDRALEFIVDYLERQVSGDMKLWISGFSRGAAVSGLTGAWFNDNASALSEKGINLQNEDIFTYTFEAPASILRSVNEQRNYTNIFNIINPNDFITMMPFEGWDFVRPGIDHVLPNFYRDKAQKLNDIIEDITGKEMYDSHNFTPYISSVGKSQSEYLKNFFDLFASRISRDRYARELENTFSHIFNKLLNSSEREMSKLVDAFTTNLLSDLGISTEDSNLGVFTLLIKLLDGDEGTLKNLSNAIGKNLEKAGYIESFDEETQRAINLLVKVLFGKDDGKTMIPYFITLLSNFRTYKDKYGRSYTLNCIVNSHTPEIAFAALVLEDDYYSGRSGEITWTRGYSSKDDTVSVIVNDGKRIYSVDYMKGSTVTLSAYATGCVSFVGWYVDGECVTEDSDYSFIIKENTNVSAASVIVHTSVTEWHIDKEAVGVEEGVVSRYCSSCGTTFTQTVEAPMTYFQLNLIILGSALGVLLVLVISTVCIVRSRRKKKQNQETTEEETTSET